MPRISVIVPHYDQKDLLIKCLRSLAAQQQAPSFEIIVGDNQTPNGIDDIRKLFPSVVFTTARERGAAPARNAALAKATGDIIAFTDSDCIAGPMWLCHGEQALRQQGVDIIGGDVLVTYVDNTHPTEVELFEQVFGFRQQLYVRKRKFSVTANLMTRADVVAKTGLFTNGLPEDIDWCHRAVALGFHLSFHGKSIVSHPARRDWAALTLKWERLINERWQTLCSTGKPGIVAIGKWYLSAVVIALSAIPHSVDVLRNVKLSGWRQHKAALKILWRIRFWRCRAMVLKMINANRGASGLAEPEANKRVIDNPRRA